MKLEVNKLLDGKTRLWDYDEIFFLKLKNESVNAIDLISKTAGKLQN
jgi:hypothetical protein